MQDFVFRPIQLRWLPVRIASIQKPCVRTTVREIADRRSKQRRHFPRRRHCVKSHDAAFYPGPGHAADRKAETHHRLI